MKAPLGKDGDKIDVFIGPEPERTNVYVVNQYKLEGGFDEIKVMLGFPDKQAAIETYDKAYTGGLGPKLRDSVISTTVDGFKKWLDQGDHKKEFKKIEESLLAEKLEFPRIKITKLDPADYEMYAGIVPEEALKSGWWLDGLRVARKKRRGVQAIRSMLEIISRADRAGKYTFLQAYPYEIDGTGPAWEAERKRLEGAYSHFGFISTGGGYMYRQPKSPTDVMSAKFAQLESKRFSEQLKESEEDEDKEDKSWKEVSPEHDWVMTWSSPSLSWHYFSKLAGISLTIIHNQDDDYSFRLALPGSVYNMMDRKCASEAVAQEIGLQWALNDHVYRSRISKPPYEQESADRPLTSLQENQSFVFERPTYDKHDALVEAIKLAFPNNRRVIDYALRHMDRGISVLVRQEGKIVALCLLGRRQIYDSVYGLEQSEDVYNRYKDKRGAELLAVAVLPEARGRGMLKPIMDYPRNLGLNYLYSLRAESKPVPEPQRVVARNQIAQLVVEDLS